MQHVWALVLAAGSGSRMASATSGIKKQFLHIDGVPLFWRSAVTFSRTARVKGLIFVFPEADVSTAQETLCSLDAGRQLGLPWVVVTGGERRQDSVACGLAALPEQCDGVLVHDAARPFATPALVNRLLDAFAQPQAVLFQGVIPALPVTDTVKVVADDLVLFTPERSTLRAVQTPQLFLRAPLEAAHARCAEVGWSVTDDASLLEQAGDVVITVPGEPENCKITVPEDLTMLKDAPTPFIPCTGWGYDVHKFGAGRPLKLGGVPIAGGPEVVAHSDGDVLLHALIDALLGCISCGDIGDLFPDTDAALDNMSSAVMLNEVLELTMQKKLTITHVDVTIITQTPKIAPHKAQIRKNISRLLHLGQEQVNVKATTEEKLGFTGQKKGIKAVACVTGLRHPSGE